MRQQSPGKALQRAVNRLFNQDPNPDPFTLRRLRKEAETLHSHDSLTATLMLARIACMEQQPELMVALYKPLLLQYPQQAWIHVEHALNLRKLGFYAAARESTLQAMAEDDTQPGIEQQIIRDDILCGYFQEAGAYLKQAVRASKPIFRAQFHFLESLQSLLIQHQWSDPMVARMQQHAMDLLHAQPLYPTGILRAPAVHISLTTAEHASLETQQTSYTPWLRWRIHLLATREQITRLNEQLQQRYAADAFLPPNPQQQIDLQLAPWQDEAIYNHPYAFYM
ncbi:hypothetical protein Mmc1_3106 [Magnetococcus marinus MC-1]|uniref:Uncharacterized protein n=1 Tax=Magnetococcus marinus (strain ATCC BAA-1437 / JCM 17883 / MC-1) TaxID=156889 RepID=A0LCA3_MAGMM|nr:hypothetical protein [Magnetococcus marinus]ABK45596.1 hypothetical protein Mmc1_3106 [Magnetococcus marinus MC-1]